MAQTTVEQRRWRRGDHAIIANIRVNRTAGRDAKAVCDH
jgi:hypothetical protein